MKYFFIVLFIVVIGYVWFLNHQSPATPTHSNPPTSITPTATGIAPIAHTVSYGDESYAYELIRANPKHVSLIPNYTKKLEFMAMITAAGCKAAISGGFYDTDFQPLGLIVIDGNIQNNAITSGLLDGFFTIDSTGKAEITALKPETAALALQSGPVIMANGNPIDLSIHNDEHARRMVVAVAPDQTLVFITVFTSDSVFDGPLLANLPQIIASIAANESVPTLDAINLDGGTASAFFSPNRALSEIRPVGSVFCIR
ncbi:MAG TPA: phosphodiester glycosidase family protein [Patescibacteria group bacterium]|nr:phosphodiester glycosidase family protein [Patescibacteria group bacterium]